MSDNSKIVNKPIVLAPDGGIFVIPNWFYEHIKEAVTGRVTGSITVNMQDGGFSSGELRKTARNHKNGNGQ